MLQSKIMTDGRIYHYSDTGMMIRQIETGNLYEDAVDVQPLRYTYEETDQPIPESSDEASTEDYEDALKRLGVNISDEE